jgi:hypothetical protein
MQGSSGSAFLLYIGYFLSGFRIPGFQTYQTAPALLTTTSWGTTLTDLLRKLLFLLFLPVIAVFVAI